MHLKTTANLCTSLPQENIFEVKAAKCIQKRSENTFGKFQLVVYNMKKVFSWILQFLLLQTHYLLFLDYDQRSVLDYALMFML